MGEVEALDVHGLENTGERFLPGAVYSAEMAYDHLTRYRLAERYVAGKDVIDMGCGAGYGTHALSEVARSILGVDLSEEAIAHDTRRYRAPNLRYEVGSVTDLPHEDGSFEAAVSFEVIEHLERPEELVIETKRVLKEDGVFVVSTPNKQTYTNNRSIVNQHHLSEMYPLQFREMLERSFEHVRIYSQGALSGSIISPDPETLPKDGRATLESAQFSLLDPAYGDGFPTTLYMIAVCTDGEPPEPLDRPLLILDRDRQIYDEYDDQQTVLRQLEMHHNYRHQMSNRHLQDVNRRLQDANRRLRETDRRLQARLQDANKRLQEANGRLQQSRREMQAMQSSRGWRIANRINVAAIKARGAAVKARGILKRGR